jgi:hypothetical protein
MTLQQKYEAASNRADSLAIKLEAAEKRILALTVESTKAKQVQSAQVGAIKPSTNLTGLARTTAAFAKST